jgi:Uma2 family endonuclease
MLQTEPVKVLWTRDEFHQMSDLGWFQDKRVELIEGEILQMPVPKPPHVIAMDLLADQLRFAFGPSYYVRTQSPLNLGLHAEPEPDICVVPGSARDYIEHPTTALVVVEISETTLNFDRNRKASLYARSGIQDYWIVNLVDEQVEVYRSPMPDSTQEYGFGYGNQQTFTFGDVIAPLETPANAIRVDDILP